MLAGDTKEIVINHPTLGKFIFEPKAGESGTIDFGGVSTEDDNKSITASGRMIKKMSRKAWGFEISCALVQGDALAFAQRVSGDVQDSAISITMITGKSFTGSGSVVGDLTGDTFEGVFTLKVQGGGLLESIN